MLPKTGSRQFVDGACCTVRYVGPLAGKDAEAVYVGVEWDDGGRGKHDGLVEGQRYFQCRPDGSGSFFKLKALRARSTDKGLTLDEALVEKYETRTAVEEQHYVMTTKAAALKIEMVGMEPESVTPVQELNTVSLSAMHIVTVAGDGSPNLATTCPQMRHLDVSSNALSDVFGLLAALPEAIESLNASINPLHVTPLLPGPATMSLRLASLETLALTDTGIGWDALRLCLASMVSLKTLDLSDNEHLGGLPDDFATFCNVELERLHFNGCNVSEWGRVVGPLEPFKSLQRLYLAHNPFVSIESGFGGLDSLQLLSVAHSGLVGFEWCGALERLEHLMHVKFNGAACHSVARSRLLVLGALTRLTHLNGAEVAERERLDANLLRERRRAAAEKAVSVDGTTSIPCPPEDMLFVKFSSSSGKASAKKMLVSPEMTVAMLRDWAFQQTGIAPFRQRLWAYIPGQMIGQS